jgi:hypothetical protein
MAAKVENNQSEFIRELAFELSAPAKVALRPSMYEEDGRSGRFAAFSHMQPGASTPVYGMNLHRRSPLGSKRSESILPVLKAVL